MIIQRRKMEVVCRVSLAGVAALLIASLTACGSTSAPDSDNADQSKPQQTGQQQDPQTLGDAILTPAEDLNLKRTDIPEVLREVEHVYSPEHVFTCAEITEEVVTLSAVLGADDDVPAEERSSESKDAADFTLDAISGIAGGLLPFRGLIKKMFGAEAHKKKVGDAYLTGLKRRAYLKGLGQSLGCEPPAAPRVRSQETAD